MSLQFQFDTTMNLGLHSHSEGDIAIATTAQGQVGTLLEVGGGLDLEGAKERGKK